MDSFERLICELLSADGWWTMQGFKVELTPEEKKRIGKPSSPRWEIDVLAYNRRDDELRVIECKSFLDSRGVKAADIINAKSGAKSRYKLFVDPVLRDTVIEALRRQCINSGLISEKTRLTLWLAAGNIRHETDEAALAKHLKVNGWGLLPPSEIKKRLQALVGKRFQDSVTNLVVKLLLH